MLFSLLVFVAAGLHFTTAIDLNVDSKESIHNALSSIATGILSYYTNSEATDSSQIGLFPFMPYYWWESGAVWGGMVDYASYTGDQTHLNMTLEALAAQVGPNYDFIMPEQVANEANDDQQFWVFSVLAAMEQGLPALPCPDGESAPNCRTSYLTLAKTVFNEMVHRWKMDSDTCNGGLRWQYTQSNNGWDYKNACSNIGFFNIAARLARYTGEAKYAHWAENVWEWVRDVEIMDKYHYIYDGASTGSNCTERNGNLWSYNTAMAIHGAAMMYNHTNGGHRWRSRVEGLLGASEALFFSPFKNSTDVMYEWLCEKQGICNTDQLSFKAYLSRYLGKTAQLAPFVRHKIHTLMRTTAIAAAKSCSGGTDGTSCGSRWYTGGYDGHTGLGQQLSALEAIQAVLAQHDKVPATIHT